MLKVLKREEKPNVDPSSSKPSWAIVRTSPKSPWKTLRLPLTIGLDVDNDIYVNAPTIRDVSKVLLNVAGVLTLVDVPSQSKVDLQSLKLFGIDILGPFAKNPDGLSTMRRHAELVLQKEASAYTQRYPNLLKKALPSSQVPRLGTIAAALVFGVLFLQSVGSDQTVQPDLSATPIAATMGNIKDLKIQSANAQSSYAKGATVSFRNAELSSTNQYALTLTVSGLDTNNELSVVLNGKLVGQTAAALNCVDNFCQREFPIDASIVQKEGNTLKVIHNAVESSYTVKNVFLRAMEPASDEEKELTQQLLTSADRYFEERHLLVQNVRTAQDAIAQAETVLTTRSGLDSLKPRFNLSKKKINEAFQDISKDLQFKLQKELKLGHHKTALVIVNDMLKLYPDPATRQNSMLMAQKKKLLEAEK